MAPALAVTALTLGAGAASLDPAPPRGQMAVVFAPWVDEDQAYRDILAAGGRIVGPTRFGNITIAFALDEGFADRVRDAGAWFTLAATGLCGPAAAPPKDKSA